MSTARRQYTDEFKREALGVLASSGRPLGQIAGELERDDFGLNRGGIPNWEEI
jgi:hypothetical protein